jgi:hypothetical protein
MQVKNLAVCCVLQYVLYAMKPTEQSKAEVLQIRLTPSEKAGISQAAALAGISVSSWVRERLRLAAIRDLESAGLRVPFVDELRLDRGNG